jgi:threonine efflux protein
MNVLLQLAIIHLVGMLVPGPNVLAVSQTALSRSRSAAVAVAFGVASAALIWAATAQAGLAVLLSGVDSVDVILRIAGATVLVFLGLQLLTSTDAATADISGPGGRVGQLYARGIVINLSNPKSFVYFTSIFTVLVPADASPAIRLAAVLVVFTESLGWHSLLAVVFSRNQPRKLYVRAAAWIDRAVGGMFLLVGARLFWLAGR